MPAMELHPQPAKRQVAGMKKKHDQKRNSTQPIETGDHLSLLLQFKTKTHATKSTMGLHIHQVNIWNHFHFMG